MLGSVGQRVGKRGEIHTFTEVVFRGQKLKPKDRPDGLIVLKNGKREWKALVETKVGTAEISADQIEKYQLIAREHGLDCVITISNQFATSPLVHPVDLIQKSRLKIPVYHWSWMFIYTTAELLTSNDAVEDKDQRVLLGELCRFLTHESSGIKGFDRMPAEWTELNRLVSAGGRIPARSSEAQSVLDAWHQETRDLSLILSRQTETTVHQKLPRKHSLDPKERQKAELQHLREHHQLIVSLDIPNAAAPLDIVADLNRRTIDVGMTLRAPEDKKSPKARVNWLLRQLKTSNLGDLYLRLNWPGRSPSTQHAVSDLLEDPSICEASKPSSQPWSFHLFAARRLGARFTQQVNFISDLENVVPEYYRDVGQNLVAWRKPAPKIKSEEAPNADFEEITNDGP